ncbi:hypothetical protein PGT21_015143 [Puccinia graminis f. sp. tritici]|uniref:Uncharacterized protein n=1 Tax=Puccinia graminis f. sp. tritici TaxID=56615 RepID=A0A5B0LMG5_PUCGR|nr:hypothetical protein PGT21_015143 [Puccinia graminis f. sp. tritici]KAA1068258.1 hypothetical protein PGTUg99_030269 [Puccinia graminis f. sp. tritici]
MSSPNSENGHQTVSSFGVFAVLLGMIIGGFLLAYMISCLQSWIDKRPQKPRQETGNTKPAVVEKPREAEKDLEAGTVISDKPATTQQDTRRSFSSIRRPGILRWSQVSERPKRDSQSVKEKISRPTRLLPTEASYVVVRSPLDFPFTNNRSSRRRSLDSQRLHHNISRRRETDLSSGKTAAELTNQTIVALTDSPLQKGQTKRTVVWFDQISRQESPLHSRGSRTNSLPSSWDEILHSPSTVDDEPPREARHRLGSVSELWLDFQTQLATG